ncbi:HVO_0649 family zinc finger protein [Haladaptatus salinisoli]|uniref:HVO_0649 family zinc finger protein n=1 Tax=Haladaptatus salinisoli TaxID=2884876 RepID=UPI0026E57549|nr:HVO_0649 family zinc finger protein [Haladaptatus salinisoli]
MTHTAEGTTPFERLTSHMEGEDLVCPDCGYEDNGGEWKAKTNGSQILYRHLCPSCGAVRKRTFDLSDKASTVAETEED